MVFFAGFEVGKQVFYASRLSVGIVNLKPLLPGHVLLLPRRVVPRLSDLTSDEVSDLFLSVQRVGAVLEKAYKAQALTVSLQDGLAAGQSVPHVHVHLIPRHSTDFEGDNDQIYPALEKHESKLKEDFKASEAVGTAWRVPKDEDRRPRTAEVMEQEAKWMESLFDESNTKINIP